MWYLARASDEVLNTIVTKVLDYDGKKKAEHMCSAVTTLGTLRTGGQ